MTMAFAKADVIYRFAPSDDPGDAAAGSHYAPPNSGIGDDLPYRVELWNAGKTEIELLLAVTASGSIGYAAYHAATREYPERYVVLRHHDGILARWNGPAH